MYYKIKFWFKRKFNDNFPSHEEVKYYVSSMASDLLTRRIHTATVEYANGKSMEDIADSLNLTRERIRQMILKGMRQLKQ